MDADVCRCALQLLFFVSSDACVQSDQLQTKDSMDLALEPNWQLVLPHCLLDFKPRFMLVVEDSSNQIQLATSDMLQHVSLYIVHMTRITTRYLHMFRCRYLLSLLLALSGLRHSRCFCLLQERLLAILFRMQ